MTYKLINDDEGNTSTIKFTNNNGQEIFIPFDPANTDYQEYLQWLDEGNTPEEADTPAEADEARLDALEKKLKK